MQAKTQAECYDYLFEAAVKMRQLGLDAARPPPPPQLPASTGNGTASAHPALPRKVDMGSLTCNDACRSLEMQKLRIGRGCTEAARLVSGMADGHAEPPAKKQRLAAPVASAGALPAAIVLDIEGTVAPISFVSEARFALCGWAV